MFSHDENSTEYSACDIKYGNCNKAYRADRSGFESMQPYEDANIEYTNSDAPWNGVHNNTCKTVLIENSLKPKSMNGWFYNLYVVESIEGLANINTSDCIDMSCLCTNNRKLTNIDVSTFNTSKVGCMYATFSNCYELTEINGISNFNTDNLVYFSYMFNNCKKLTSLDLSRWNTSNVEAFGFESVFSGCESLQTLDVSSFNTSSKTVYIDHLFENCKKLTSLDLSSFTVTSNMIASKMFYGCSNLRTINYGSNFGKPKKNYRYVYKLPSQ